MPNRHHNTEHRIKKVCKIVQIHYQEGCYSHCYKAIWEKYVNPIYPMSYRTFLRYINTPISRGKNKKSRRN